MDAHEPGVCACSACAYAAGSEEPPAASASSAKPILPLDQVLTKILRWGAEWAPDPVDFSFYEARPSFRGGADYDGYFAFSAEQRNAVRLAFELISDIASVTFLEAPDNQLEPSAGNQRLSFGNSSTMPAHVTGWTLTDISATPVLGSQKQIYGAEIWFNPAKAVGPYDPGGRMFMVTMHEIMHALGMPHPGEYNRSATEPILYDKHAEYMQDSLQYTVLSYFGAEETGAQHGFGSAGTGRFASTPLLHDVAALQALYGANLGTRAGDTVYGYGSTAGRSQYDFGVNAKPVLAIWDAGGLDRLDFSGSGLSVNVDLSPGAFSDAFGMTRNIAIAHGVTIEDARGGSGADVLSGNAAANTLHGGGGDDRLHGGFGADILVGGSGGDLLFGEDGDDLLGGQDGGDYVAGGLGRDTLLGEAGDDALVGGEGADHLVGGDGADLMGGQDGDDVLEAGAGADVLLGEGGRDILVGGADGDRAYGGADDDLIGGQDGGDYLEGGDGDDVILGEAGRDSLVGGSGADRMYGGADDDLMGGQSGDDFMDGAEGADTLYGEAGRDVLVGGVGDDRLYGMEDDDLMGGQDGADFLDGGGGLDVLFGEAGRDVLVGGASADQMYGGTGDDLLGGQDGDDFLSGDEGVDTLFGEEGRDRLVGGAGDDVLAGGGEADVFLFGLGAGADRLLDFGTGDRFDLAGRRFTALKVNDVDGDGRADSTLSHEGGTVLLLGVSDLTLDAWNALVL